jgi:hypothetical protein
MRLPLGDVAVVVAVAATLHCAVARFKRRR